LANKLSKGQLVIQTKKSAHFDDLPALIGYDTKKADYKKIHFCTINKYFRKNRQKKGDKR
jgi:hypothetical protein